MGPQRHHWTFPKTGQELIDACKKKEAALVSKIEENLSEDQLREQEIEEYREELRIAGVRSWKSAIPENGQRYSYSKDKLKHAYQKAAKDLDETRLFRDNLEKEWERNSSRLYKVSHPDLVWFGL